MTLYNHCLLFNRLSGILHVLYSAIKICLPPQPANQDISDSENDLPQHVAVQSSFSRIISKETTEMAVNLTEYFQTQRKIYENVSYVH